MAKFKSASRADRNTRLGTLGAFGALAAAFAGKAAAQTSEAPAGFDPLSALGEIKEATQLADGTLQVVLANGKTIIVSAADFVVVGSEYFIAESAVATLLAVPAGLGAGAVLGGVGAVGAVGAVAGGGGGGDDAPPVSPPLPPPPPPPPPPPASPVFTSGTTATFAENGTGAVYMAVATDADSPTLTYSITGGADASRFAINATTGVVTFVSPPNFEAPTDVGADNVYDLQITASDGTNTAVRSVAVTVTNVNDVAPVFTSGTAVTFAENGTGTVYTATATDADGPSVTYAITGGVDAHRFSINAATGAVTFISPPDFEAKRRTSEDGPKDAGNVYELQITASDGAFSTVQSVSVTVTDVNDVAPVFLSGGTATVAENSTGTAYGVVAFDPDSPTVTYSITGGADAARFAIDTVTGVVTFVSPPNFEAPTDVGANNVYDLQITASDGTFSTVQSVAVTVTDVAEQTVIDLTTFSASQGFVIQADAEGDTLGWSVSSAGDVNGDGLDDLIIGAPFGDDGGQSSGEAYVVFGSTSGFGTDVGGRRVIDLTSLSASQGFIIQGDTLGDQLGIAVATAGDVNGDGIADLIVGANSGDDGGQSAGEAYVVFGSSGSFGVADGSGRQVIDLTTLNASQGFIIQGDAANDVAGRSVGSAGDVNGDGFDDLIVGASTGDDGGTDAGEAYVVFGGAGTFGTATSGRQVIDLTDLNASQGFIIQGDTAGDRAGTAVSSAGDINGDGYDDLIVGALFGDDGGTDASEAYVVFGGAGTFGTPVGGRQVIDLSSLGASQGFIIQGDAAYDTAGRSVSSAGDVNGDGFDDLIVGASRSDNAGTNAGETYVLFGGAGTFGTDVSGRQVIDLTALNSAQGFIIRGGVAGDASGYSVSSAGDVNGDGFDDLIVGSPYGDDGGTNAGEAYVVFGGAGTFGTADGSGRQVIDLATLSASQGFIIQGDTATDTAGIAVSSAGDVNGDGYDDVFVGARSGDDGGVDAGEGYVVFGGAAGTESTVAVSRTGTSSADNFTGNAGNDTFTGIGANDVVRGGAGNDAISVSALGFADIEGGRGTDTLALSGAGQTLDLTGPGNARVDSIEVIDLTGSGNNTVILDQQAIFDLTEERSGGDATLTVRGNAGDTADLGGAGGGFLATGTVTDAGITYSVFSNGNANVRVQTGVTVLSEPPPAQVIELASLSAAEGFIIQGDLAYNRAGFAVSSAGDVNGDGFEDVIVSAPFANGGGSDSGDSYVLFGSAGGFGTSVSGSQVIDLTTLGASQGFIIRGISGERSGYSASSAGDINGDGFDDLIIGGPTGNLGGGGSGQAYVVFGGAGTFGTEVSGRQVINVSTLSASQGFVIRGDLAYDRAGQSVASAGDVNGDGYDDLIVGASSADGGGGYSGNSYIVFGGSGTFGVATSGRQVLDLTNLVASQGFIIFGDEGGDLSGISVDSAGDVNGDGFDDLIVGARNGDDGGANAGEAYVVFGGAGTFGVDASGRDVVDLTTLSTSRGFVIQGAAASDVLGGSVGAAGDVNGDGFDDIIVGATANADGGSAAGASYVVFGGSGGFGTTDGTGRQVVNVATLGASQGFIVQGANNSDLSGVSVSSAGDVNGDGFADLIIGALGSDLAGADAGTSYVVYGSANGFGTPDGSGRQVIDLETLDSRQGILITGGASGDLSGAVVSSAGDINGDGFDDLLVGASLGDLGGTSAGQAYVVFGGATGTESTVAVSRTGTGSVDNFTGNAGDDTFTGIGANDVVRGGAGDDAISLSALGFADIDGGRGTDTLALTGSGQSLDLAGPGNAGVSSIEVIDLTGSGNNTVILDQQAVFDLTEERSGGDATLTIRGNAGDMAALGGFTANGTAIDGGITYDVFTHGNANVRVQQGVTVTGVAFSAEVADSDPKGVQVAEPVGLASDWDSAPVFQTAKLEVFEDQPLDLNSGFSGAAGVFDAGDVWTPAGFALDGLDIINGGAADFAIQREAQLAADLLLIDAAMAAQGN